MLALVVRIPQTDHAWLRFNPNASGGLIIGIFGSSAIGGHFRGGVGTQFLSW
ncbi:hypothetical protein CCP3SC1_520021 [Gammaproteobacteria bacterium]